MKSGPWSVNDVLNELSLIPAGKEPYLEPLHHGTIRLGLYAPREHDSQPPHDQDVLCFVISGSGLIVHGGDKSEFRTGDALFVALGMIQRFEEFIEDFRAWAGFWGK